MSQEYTFGPYTLMEPLGKGGMAITFKARERLELGGERLVVVKQILPQWTTDERFQRMFLDEARVSSQLNHNNLCRVYKGGRIDDMLFLAMEYIDGTDLMELFRKARRRKVSPLPLAHVLFIVEQVLLGLDAAHSATNAKGKFLNLVHRDISPHNVLISRRGEVKIIDFGVAKSVTNVDHTVDGAVKGKVAYASPEQINREDLDRRSDLFAVGLLIYKLTTGQHPLAGSNQVETFERFRRYMRGELTIEPPSSKTPAALPPELDAIVAKALEVDRNNRYPNADAMAQEIGDLLYTLFPRYRTKTLQTLVTWALDPHSGNYIPPPETIPIPGAWTADDTAIWDPQPSSTRPSPEESSRQITDDLETSPIAAEPSGVLLAPDDPAWTADSSEPPTLMQGKIPESLSSLYSSDPDDTVFDYDLQISFVHKLEPKRPPASVPQTSAAPNVSPPKPSSVRETAKIPKFPAVNTKPRPSGTQPAMPFPPRHARPGMLTSAPRPPLERNGPPRQRILVIALVAGITILVMALVVVAGLLLL